jgi:hypothetical protein
MENSTAAFTGLPPISSTDSQEIYRAGSGSRFNHLGRAAAEFEAVGRMVAEVVGGQARNCRLR